MAASTSSREKSARSPVAASRRSISGLAARNRPQPQHQPAHGEGRLDADGKDAGPVAAPRLEHGPADAREGVAQGRLELLTHRVDLDAATDPPEQRHADLRLQGLDLMAHRRMGDMQLVRCA